MVLPVNLINFFHQIFSSLDDAALGRRSRCSLVRTSADFPVSFRLLTGEFQNPAVDAHLAGGEMPVKNQYR